MARFTSIFTVFTFIYSRPGPCSVQSSVESSMKTSSQPQGQGRKIVRL